MNVRTVRETPALLELAAKAHIDLGELRTILANAAREVVDVGEWGELWVESWTSATVVLGIYDDSGKSKFIEAPYDFRSGVATIDMGQAKEVRRTYLPIDEFNKTAAEAHFVMALDASSFKVAEDGRRIIEGYASVWGVTDRDGERMVKGAFKDGLPEFMSAPAMLFNHGKDPEIGRWPIGTWLEVKEDDHGLWVRGEVARGDKNADRVWNLIEQGVLNALSVGGRMMKRGKDIVRWDLLEISVASVPSNAFATFRQVKDAQLVPPAYREGELLRDKLTLARKASPDAADAIAQAIEVLNAALNRANQSPAPLMEAERWIESELRPAMELGVKALSGKDRTVDVNEELRAAIADAVKSAFGGEDFAKGLGGAVATAVASTMDERERARAEAEKAAAEAAAKQKEHDDSVAQAAIQKFVDGLRAKGFNPVSLDDVMPDLSNKAAGDGDGEGGKSAFNSPFGDPLVPQGMKSAPSGIVRGFSRYDGLQMEDLAYMHESGKALFPHLAANTGQLWRPNRTLLKALAVKSARLFEKGELPESMPTIIGTKWIAPEAEFDQYGNPLGGGEWGGKQIYAPWAYKTNELMESDLAGFGDEWVPTLWTSVMWERVRLENRIVSFLAEAGQVIDMPSDPYITPLEHTDPAVKKAAQADLATDFTFPGPAGISRVGTANIPMSTSKLMVVIPFTRELEEDSIIPVVPQLRAQTERAFENAVENVIINGDTTTGASSNINDIAGTPAATDLFLTADGLRHLGLVTTPSDAVSIGTLTLQKIRRLRQLMGTNGKLGMRPSDLMIVCDGSTYYVLLDLDETVTVDKFGPGATVRTGGLESIDNIRIHASEEMVLANTAGKIDLDVTANNTTGTILIFNRRQFRLGYRRRLTMSVERVPFADGGYLVASLRMAFQARDTEGVAVGYGVDVDAA